jgi:putative phage-type endonuclease
MSPMQETSAHKIEFKTKDEWYKFRHSFIGASEIAALFGKNDWDSPYAIWSRKINQTASAPDSKYTLAGKRQEPIILQYFQDVKRPDVASILAIQDQVYYNDLHMIASIDYDLEIHKTDGTTDYTFLECKFTTVEENWDNKVPDKYYLQCQHQMYVRGVDHCYLAVLINGVDYKEYYVTLDRDKIPDILNKVQWIWDLIEKKTPPPIDDLESTRKAIQRNNGDIVDSEIVSQDLQVKQLLIDYKRLTAVESETKKEKDTIKNKLYAILGNNRKLTIDDCEVSQRFQEKKSYQVAASSSYVISVKVPESYYADSIAK